ncbi:ATP-dependent Clp protease proteolytic subunit-related protein 4, chloroplastic [Asimina triloba]
MGIHRREFVARLIARCSDNLWVIPFRRGNAWEQPPPDLASYLYKNRIIYLGMSLVPSVTELMLAQFLYLQFEDMSKPVYLYINSTGTTKKLLGGETFVLDSLEVIKYLHLLLLTVSPIELNYVLHLSRGYGLGHCMDDKEGGVKYGYETEAFAIYDVMRYMGAPVFTLCVGNAWGEAALLLAAGAKGNRAALPSSTIMIRQPISRAQGQASDVEILRKEIRNVKAELVKLYAKHMGKTPEQIEEDIKRPKYFSPSEAVEYGIIDKVLYSARSKEDRGMIANLKKAKMI